MICAAFRVLALVLVTSLAYPVLPAPESVRLAPGMRVYLSLDGLVSGRRHNGAKEGDRVPCRVWRDVVVDGMVVIAAGTEATARVDQVRHAQIAGVQGKLELSAVETRTIDGQIVNLEGGYNKAGKNRMAASIALGAVLLLPLIFITGKPAELPMGTVIDTYTVEELKIARSQEAEDALVPTIDLGSLGGAFSADVDIKALESTKKPEVFRLIIENAPAGATTFVVDRVNEKKVPPIGIELLEGEGNPEVGELVGTVKIKELAKHFAKGVNRFEVATGVGEDRESTEIVLNIQF